MRCSYSLLFIFMLLPLHAVADTAVSSEKAALHPLSPVQIQQIQGVSHAVLAAQGSQIPDPQKEALRQEIKALGVALDEAVLAITTTPPKLNYAKQKVEIRNPSGQARLINNNQAPIVIQSGGELSIQKTAPLPADSVASVEETPVTHEPVHGIPQERVQFDKNSLSKVQNHLASVRQHRQSLEAQVQEHAGENNADEMRALPASVAHLENDLSDALNSPDGPDVGKLVVLRDRLKPKTYAELRKEQQHLARENGESIPEPTPTFSTITKHR